MTRRPGAAARAERATLFGDETSQAVAYVGTARAADFVCAVNDVLTERGVALPLEGMSTTMLDGLTVLLPLVGYPRTLNALAAVNQVAPA